MTVKLICSKLQIETTKYQLCYGRNYYDRAAVILGLPRDCPEKDYFAVSFRNISKKLKWDKLETRKRQQILRVYEADRSCALEWPALWRITMNSLHNEGV